MPIFGYNVQGLLGTRDIDDTIVGSVFSCPEAGEAQSITAAVGGDICLKKCAIYKHSDLSLVGVTSQVNTAAGWRTYPFTAPKPILAADDYVLVIWGDRAAPGPPLFGYDDGNGPDPGNQGHFDAEVYNGFPDPMVPTHEDRKYSIYCTYDLLPEPEGGGAGAVVMGTQSLILDLLLADVI